MYFPYSPESHHIYPNPKHNISFLLHQDTTSPPVSPVQRSNECLTRNKRIWTAEEDALLHQLVKQHGPRGWNLIGSHFAKKTPKQCRDRWHNQLNPEIVSTPWTASEEQRLIDIHKQFGNRWARIAKYFPGRTSNSIKNRFRAIQSYQQKML